MKIIITENQLKRLILESDSPCPKGEEENELKTVKDLKGGKTISLGYCNSSSDSAIVFVQKKLKELGFLKWDGDLGYFGQKTLKALCDFLEYEECEDTIKIGKNTIKKLESGTNSSIDEKNLKDFSENGEASKGIKDFIKSFEKLRLKAYDIKDGKITIGYGHTEGVKKGDEITEEEAEEFFEEDIQTAEDVVIDILSAWKEGKHTYKITQSMFDALVSLAYNSGRGTLRSATVKGSKFLSYLKKGDYKTASEKIETYALSDKFTGLIQRRKDESKWFCKEGC